MLSLSIGNRYQSNSQLNFFIDFYRKSISIFDCYRLLSIDYAWSNQESPEFIIIISPTPLTPLDPTINMHVLQVTFHKVQGAFIMRISYYKDSKAGNGKSTCAVGEYTSALTRPLLKTTYCPKGIHL